MSDIWVMKTQSSQETNLTVRQAKDSAKQQQILKNEWQIFSVMRSFEQALERKNRPE